MSKEVWQAVDLWRPRSCYIYIARKCLKSPNYKPWNDFSFDDYLQRQHLMKTFETRHLPVLRGEVDIPLKYLPDPDCWTVDSESDTPVKKKRKSAKTKSPSHCKHVQRKLMWDFELEKWVPNEMGTQAPPRSTVALRDPQLKERKRRGKKRKRRRRSPSAPASPESAASLDSFTGILDNGSASEE